MLTGKVPGDMSCNPCVNCLSPNSAKQLETNKNKQIDLDIGWGFMSRFRHKNLNMYYTKESPGRIVDYDVVDMCP